MDTTDAFEFTIAVTDENGALSLERSESDEEASDSDDQPRRTSPTGVDRTPTGPTVGKTCDENAHAEHAHDDCDGHTHERDEKGEWIIKHEEEHKHNSDDSDYCCRHHNPWKWSILVTPPDTHENFLAYYHEQADLDSDYLMVPQCEADYDSETQCLVDMQDENGPRSFFQHFVYKRKKKKFHKKGVKQRSTTDEQPEEGPQPPPVDHLKPSTTYAPTPTHLAALPNPKDGLSDRATRRRACGYVPDEMRQQWASDTAYTALFPDVLETLQQEQNYPIITESKD